MLKNVLVLGGEGYVGSRLLPELLKTGRTVTSLDTGWYRTGQYKPDSKLRLITGDIRDRSALRHAMKNQDAVIHLSCVSNDPSFELNPELGKAINLDSFPGVIDELRSSQVKRFIYASSSSVYGIKEQRDVTEKDTCEPLTDYSKFKLMCEDMLRSSHLPIDWSIVRPATVCGYAPRLRLDLIVNILTINALVNKRIVVHGGNQLRPNLNIRDMVSAYITILDAPSEKINQQVFNVGFENMNLMQIARLVQSAMGKTHVEIERVNSNDNRSYHVNSDKIARILNFRPRFSINQAIHSIVLAYAEEKIKEPLTNSDYYNIKKMQELQIT